MYLKWNEQVISDFSELNITALYEKGFLFGRQEHGSMYQTRSIRVPLSGFDLNSENRRVIRKTEALEHTVIPLPDPTYHWSAGKMAKDFYDTKFGDATFSANKVKELLQSKTESNFNLELVYRFGTDIVGYAICYENPDLLHYAYPFYDLQKADEMKDIGMGMMLRAILYAQRSRKKYIYMGSAQRPTDVYKLQFKAVEWFDGKTWSTNIDALKIILA